MADRYAKTKHVDELSDVDLLATQLRAQGSLNAAQRASALISDAGSLRSVIYKTREDANARPCLSVSETTRIQAGIELGRRITFESVADINVMDSPQAVRDFLTLQLADREHEIFAALYLDNRHRVIEFKEVFGTIDSAAVYPREVVKRCLASNAAAVIFAHNLTRVV